MPAITIRIIIWSGVVGPSRMQGFAKYGMDRVCGTCAKEIKDIEPAQCSYCENFYHIKAECSDVTRSYMQVFFSTRKALWLCPNCRDVFSNRTVKSLLQIEQERQGILASSPDFKTKSRS
ncbi:hypothetical protein quinque_001249 [Culex quinquefasciatus]